MNFGLFVEGGTSTYVGVIRLATIHCSPARWLGAECTSLTIVVCRVQSPMEHLLLS